MAGKFELHAETRRESGRGASRRLRRVEDKVPTIMYGGGEPAVALAVDHKQLKKALENEAFYSHILTINIDNTPHQAVLKDLQRHPYKPRIQHMDLLRITGKEKIFMQVPLHFKNGDIAPGVKTDGGIVSHLMNNVEVKCFPKDLPEFIEVDLANLALNQSVHLSELKLPNGVELAAFTHGNIEEHDQPVASIHIPRAALATEETTEAPAASAVPASQQAAPEKAAAPAAADKGKAKK